MVCDWAIGQSKNRASRFPLPQTGAHWCILLLSTSCTWRLLQPGDLDENLGSQPLARGNQLILPLQPARPFAWLTTQRNTSKQAARPIKQAKAFGLFSWTSPYVFVGHSQILGLFLGGKGNFQVTSWATSWGGVKTAHTNTLQRLRNCSPGSKHHFTAPESGLQMWFAL